MTNPAASPFEKNVAISGVPAFAAALQEASDFVAVGTIVCVHNRERFGLHQTAFVLFGADGRPVLSVDDVPRISDESRLAYFETTWRALEPYLERLRTSHLPIADENITADITRELVRSGYTGDPVFMFVLPLLEPGGVFGMMVCGSLRAHTDEMRRTLMIVAHHASVRLAQLGVRRVREPSIASRLTSRQLEVAQLAARGRTNAGIGDALDMSENTVKKHLKDIFERLGVETRAELATVLLRAAPHEHVPIGITHRGHLTITRAP